MKLITVPIEQSILDAVEQMTGCPICGKSHAEGEIFLYPDGAWCPECNANLLFNDGTWGDAGCTLEIRLQHIDETRLTPAQQVDLTDKGRHIVRIDYVYKCGEWCYGPYLFIAGADSWFDTRDPIGIWREPKEWSQPYNKE